MHTRGSDEEHLDALFAAYRAACPDAEPGADFMPQLWQRIEGRRTFSFFLGRLASGFVTAAVAATLAMAVYLYYPRTGNPYYSESYVEALAGHSGDNAEFFEAVYLESSEGAGQL
jgi:acyl dehydratase